MKIASIYNDIKDIRMDVIWEPESKQISYRNIENGEECSSGESAETLNEAIDNTYARYCYGWDLVFEEV